MAVPQTAYNTLMGMFRPQQAPAGASVMEQAQADARNQMLGRLGFGLLAAAIPQTAAQRTQSLQQALGGMGDMNTAVYNNAQARLMAKELEAKEAAMRSDQDFLQNFVRGSIGATVAPTAPIIPTVAVAPSDDFRAPSPAAQRIIAPAPPSAIPPAQNMPVKQQLDQYGLLPEQNQRILNLVQQGVIKNADELRSEIKKEAMSNLEPEKPLSNLAQLRSDYQNNLITKEEYDRGVAAATAGATSPLGQILSDPTLNETQRERLADAYVRQQESAGLSPLQSLINDEKLKTEHPEIWKAAIEKLVAPEGMRIETAPDGSVTIRQGDAPADDSIGKELGKAWRAGIDAALPKAESAAQDIAVSNELLGIIDQGVNFGQAGGAFNWLNTQLSNIGVVDESGNTLNTNTYAALVGRRVAEVIKQFGAGTGLSNADREYAQKIAAADPQNITPDQARRLLEIANKANRAFITQYNKRYITPLDKAIAEKKVEPYMVDAFRIPVPPEYVPPVTYDPDQGTLSGGAQ